MRECSRFSRDGRSDEKFFKPVPACGELLIEGDAEKGLKDLVRFFGDVDIRKLFRIEDTARIVGVSDRKLNVGAVIVIGELGVDLAFLDGGETVVKIGISRIVLVDQIQILGV